MAGRDTLAARPIPTAGATGTRIDEVLTKLGLVRGWLGAHGLRGAVVGSQAGFAWATAGGHSHVAIGEAAGVAWVLVTQDGAFVLTTNIERPRLVDEELAGLPFEVVDWPWHDEARARAALAGLCPPDRTASDVGLLGIRPLPASFAALRHTLLPAEVARYRLLGVDAAEAVEAACRATSPGDTEQDVAARVAFECRRRDILPLVDLVAADDRIARYRHPLPTTARLRRTLLVALTGRRHGLHASLTRMVSFGTPDDELVARHRRVTAVDTRLNLASRPGVSLGEVLRAGMDQYRAEGHPGEWHRHHQGGLTGYAGREVFATPGAGHRLAPWQAVAWNPSITRVKSEDTVLVGPDGVEVLTRSGHWPERAVSLDAGTLVRPDLLVTGPSERAG